MAERAKIIPWTLTSPGVIIATFWDEDKSIKKEKEDKGKGWDWSKSIQGISLNEARAWFKDYENLAAKSGKA